MHLHIIIKILFLVSCLSITFCYGERYLTLQHHQRGDSSALISTLTIYNNVSDFQELAPGIAAVAQRICAKGLWITYNEANYTGNAKPHPNQDEWETEICLRVNRGSQTIGSARYVGPDAESTELTESRGLTLFSGVEFEGEAFRVENPADAHLPFIPKSLLITGSKNPWTLYTGTNFNGTAKCYGGGDRSRIYEKVNQLDRDVKSVSIGCYGYNY